MLKRLVPLLALALALAACADADPTTSIGGRGDSEEEVRAGDGDAGDSPIAGSVEDVLAELSEQGFNGLVMIADGDDVNTAGFGLADREADAPWDENTVFTVGSITKQFTAAAILTLEMDGRLSVEDRLGNLLPDVSGELAGVTLHQLLTHTGGLPGSLGGDFDPTSSADIIELSSDAVDAAAIGTFRYSNPGYSLLGVVIEEVTGDTYEQYLRTALFEPAGMADTGYRLAYWSGDLEAVGYEGERSWGRLTDRPWADDGPYWHLRANGGILSTGADLVAWHHALLGDDILDEAAKVKLYGRHVAEDPGGGEWYYGYGWSNVALPDGDTLIIHNGGNGVFFADFLRFLDDDLTILVATNEAGADEDVAFRIADAVRGTAYAGPDTSCAPQDVDGLQVLPDVPEGAVGTTLAALRAAVTTADDSERKAFAAEHVAMPLIADLSPEDVSAEIVLVQEELAPFTFADIRRSADDTYHLVFTADAADADGDGDGDGDGDAVITAVIGSGDPSSITCIDVGFGY